MHVRAFASRLRAEVVERVMTPAVDGGLAATVVDDGVAGVGVKTDGSWVGGPELCV